MICDVLSVKKADGSLILKLLSSLSMIMKLQIAPSLPYFITSKDNRFSSYSLLLLFSSSENEIFNHNEEHNNFFDHLMSLVAESIAQIPVSGEPNLSR
jgi:FPC/CPF motif-containing protein YcgG